MKNIILFIFFLAILSSCSSERIMALERENERLKAENDRLTRAMAMHIRELENAAGKTDSLYYASIRRAIAVKDSLKNSN